MRDHCRKEKVDDQVPTSRARSEIQSTKHNTKAKRNSNRDVDELSNVNHVVTNAKPSRFEAQLYIFEDNEAVIRMLMNDRSPTIRHVSRNPTELRWISCLTESFERQNPNQIC